MDFSHSICMAAGPGHLPDLTLLATFADKSRLFAVFSKALHEPVTCRARLV